MFIIALLKNPNFRTFTPNVFLKVKNSKLSFCSLIFERISQKSEFQTFLKLSTPFSYRHNKLYRDHILSQTLDILGMDRSYIEYVFVLLPIFGNLPMLEVSPDVMMIRIVTF